MGRGVLVRGYVMGWDGEGRSVRVWVGPWVSLKGERVGGMGGGCHCVGGGAGVVERGRGCIFC